MHFYTQKRLAFGEKRRRHYGNGSCVQDASRATSTWSANDDQLISQYPVLDESAVGKLVLKLNRPPSQIRARHTYLLQQHLRDRKEAAARISDRLNTLRQKQQHPH